MQQPDRQSYTVEEYLWEEQRSKVKRDFLNGQVYALAGGSLEHSLIAVNLVSVLHTQLRGSGCQVFNSDLKIAIPGNPRSKGRKRSEGDEFVTYPDAGIICGQPEYYKGDRFTIANPVALFEILSPSTRIYDRNTKAEEYKKIPGLNYYVIIDSEEVRVECRQRVAGNAWMELTPLELLEDKLKLVFAKEIEISLASLYEGITFEEDEV
ncbi:MAG: Uma2 family endonuclease [Chloroflexi bacterium]|uniref:Uma2 family endonuclease n=1 Tax=Candidatus Chlorohelix allophototropha TaxID=3003348 RepID=A0A8T7M3W7_9CHLR|nr:Uma2 family endonuclease [Chloroflexota bacterium]NWJ46772.1 Uma2 family endonuclease [Chloroflexota bacterium]WJW70242.1 Uma2 family endonuclease [Chloroflexota bacterium L227-S17]